MSFTPALFCLIATRSWNEKGLTRGGKKANLLVRYNVEVNFKARSEALRQNFQLKKNLKNENFDAKLRLALLTPWGKVTNWRVIFQIYKL